MFIGYEKVATTSAPKDVSDLSPPNGATFAIIQAETQPIRFRLDGGAPDTTTGMILLTATQGMELLIEDLKRIQFCSSGGGDGTLHIHYAKGGTA